MVIFFINTFINISVLFDDFYATFCCWRAIRANKKKPAEIPLQFTDSVDSDNHQNINPRFYVYLLQAKSIGECQPKYHRRNFCCGSIMAD